MEDRDVVQFLGERHEPSDVANQVNVTQWEANVDQDMESAPEFRSYDDALDELTG